MSPMKPPPHITSPDAAQELDRHLTATGWQSHLLAHFFVGCDNTLTEVVQVYATRGDLRLTAKWTRPTGVGEWAAKAPTATLRGPCHLLADFRCAHPLDHHDAAVVCLLGLSELRWLADMGDEQATRFVRSAPQVAAVVPGGAR